MGGGGGAGGSVEALPPGEALEPPGEGEVTLTEDEDSLLAQALGLSLQEIHDGGREREEGTGGAAARDR